MKRDGDTLRFVCKQVRHEVKPYANSYQHLTCDTSLYGLTCADDSVEQDRCLVRYIDITGKGVPKALVVSLMQKIRRTFPNLMSIEFDGLAQDREMFMQEKDSIFRSLGLGVGSTDMNGDLVWSSVAWFIQHPLFTPEITCGSLLQSRLSKAIECSV